jgi:aspartyl protease
MKKIIYPAQHRRLRSTILLLGILLLLAGCAGSASDKGRHTPRPTANPPTASFSVRRPGQLPEALRIQLRNHRGYLFARAEVDGRDAGLFMFDTGSSLNVVSTGVAGRLGLPTGGSSTATGVGGKQAFDFRPIRSLEFGGLGVAGDRLAAISLHTMSRALGTSVSGLVGINALDGLPFTLDYRDSTLTVYRRDTFTGPAGVPVFPARFDLVGLPVIEAEVGKGHKVWLILDSGADNELTLPRRCLVDWPEIVAVPGSGAGASSGIGGSVASTRTWLGSLEIFGLELKNTPVTFEQSTGALANQSKPIGRIGGAMLKNFRLTIDPKGRRIWAQWLPGEIQE